MVNSANQGKVNRLKHGITRMEEANDSIAAMDKEIADLQPVLEDAQTSVKQSHDDVETSQAEYQDQKEACKNKEIEIQRLQDPVEILKKETDEEYGKVSTACHVVILIG